MIHKSKKAMMKEIYMAPRIEVIEIEPEAVIAASFSTPGVHPEIDGSGQGRSPMYQGGVDNWTEE